MRTFEATTHSAEETIALAERLGSALVPGTVLLLEGELGSGKTTFVQGLARGLGLADEARSPTFVLVHEYRRGPVPLIHADFYRLAGPEEALDLGLEDVAAGGVLAIEWPERAGDALPEDGLRVAFLPEDDAETRVIRMEARGKLAEAALEALAASRGVA